jgi:hypothetical protein
MIMADKPFDRVIINPRERPVSSDIVRGHSEVDRTIRTALDYLFRGRVSIASGAFGTPVNGFMGNSLRVGPVSPVAMQVTVPAGLGFYYDPTDTPSSINGIVGLDDLSAYKPMMLNQDATFTVPAAPGAPNNRTDIIEVRDFRQTVDLSSRDVLNIATGVFEPTNVLKTVSFSLDGSLGVVVSPANSTTAIGYKVGLAGAPGGVPATSPGYIKIAEIYVDNTATSIDANAICDMRKLIFPSNMGLIRACIQAPTTGPLTPVMLALQAPPGVKVSAVAISNTNAETHLYVIAGDPPTPYQPIALVSPSDTTGAYVYAASVLTITSTEQTLLAGAQANPPIKVAAGFSGGVGQRAIRIVLKSPSTANPYTYYAQVALTGV